MVVLEVRRKPTGPVASESLTTGLMTVILSTAFHLSFFFFKDLYLFIVYM